MLEEEEENEEAQSLQKKKKRRDDVVKRLIQNISQEQLEAVGLDPAQLQTMMESGQLEDIFEKVMTVRDISYV